METVLQIANLVVTTACVLVGLIFIIGDSAARVEWFRDKFPRLQGWTERKNSVVYLLLVTLVLQVLYISDLGLKEFPPVPNVSLPAFATIPAPIIQQTERSTAVSAPSRGTSLRDRANKLANELQAFTDERDKHMPPLIEKGPMTTEQLQAAQAPQYHYLLETYKLYEKQFSVRVVTVVAEFKAHGLDVSPIESCAAAGVCSPTPIPVELHALAARLDDNGNVRRQN
jgi:hypothetical protein